MANVTLAEAIQLTRDRALLLATTAIPNASGAYAYADQRPAYGQYFEFLIHSCSMKRPGGSNTQQWTFNAELRFNVGQFTQDYPGQVYQTAVFLYLPQAAQTFEQYRRLNDPTDNTSQGVPYLNPELSYLSNGKSTFIENVQWLIFSFTLVLDTTFARCGL